LETNKKVKKFNFKIKNKEKSRIDYLRILQMKMMKKLWMKEKKRVINLEILVLMEAKIKEMEQEDHKPLKVSGVAKRKILEVWSLKAVLES
jgi:hypothetical protein